MVDFTESAVKPPSGGLRFGRQYVEDQDVKEISIDEKEDSDYDITRVCHKQCAGRVASITLFSLVFYAAKNSQISCFLFYFVMIMHP